MNFSLISALLLLLPLSPDEPGIVGRSLAGGTVQGTVRIETQLTSVARARGSRYRSRGQAETETATSKSAAPEVTNVVVYLEELGGKKRYAPPSQPVRLIQKSTQFIPHVLPIVRGTRVEIVNKDPYYHNVFSNSDAKRFNIGRQVTDAVVTEVFETTEFIPVFCDIHLEMSAYVVVLDNPYFAQPSADGRYTIPDVPPGRYRLHVWHERLPGTPQEITVADGGTVTVNVSL